MIIYVCCDTACLCSSHQQWLVMKQGVIPLIDEDVVNWLLNPRQRHPSLQNIFPSSCDEHRLMIVSYCFVPSCITASQSTCLVEQYPVSLSFSANRYSQDLRYEDHLDVYNSRDWHFHQNVHSRHFEHYPHNIKQQINWWMNWQSFTPPQKMNSK